MGERSSQLLRRHMTRVGFEEDSNGPQFLPDPPILARHLGKRWL
jgi:hypothetical protein